MSRQRAERESNVLYLEFWHDRLVQTSLAIDQAFFYLMLITRWPRSITGIVEVSVADLCYQFRPEEFPMERVLATLATLEETGRIIYDTGTLWTVNYFRWHTRRAPGKPALYGATIARQLGTCHSRAIYDGWIKKYDGHPLMPSPLPPYRYRDAEPPPWFSMGGPAPRKRPPLIPAAPAPPAQMVPEVRADVQRVWDVYVEIMDSTMSLTATRRTKILARLSDKITDPTTKQVRRVTPDDLIAAIRACRASAFHMGDNDRRTRYTSLEDNILKSQEQLEKWLEKAALNGRPSDTPLTDAGLISDRAREREITRMAQEGPLRLPGHRGWDIQVEEAQ